ncbi:hypothetical protein PVAP13_6NG204612 [Panicum virgatum]|uniref:Uncharacterized protein n=1 Tax=Panicum virgatum TaxID=38727 RepID=A0A8T0QYV1_PANVG|nr:hypothetical protein PVAP13_6NG204612 [Panicum virgatum]
MKVWRCMPPPPPSEVSTPSGAESDDDDQTLAIVLGKQQKENPRSILLKRKAPSSEDIGTQKLTKLRVEKTQLQDLSN